jgi:hypothetical protein
VRCASSLSDRFSQELPGVCRLLRTKLFRLPAWTDEEDDDVDAPMSAQSLSRAKSSTPQLDTHPFFLQSSRSTAAKQDPSRAPSRSRSRSLSVSLAQEAQEAEARRANNVRPNRGLEREWSMNRSFKCKEKARETVETIRSTEASAAADRRIAAPVVLVEGTPVKPKKRRPKEDETDKLPAMGGSTMYIAETPVNGT